METVSVLVPIFNSAPYLAQCLDSIIRQTYPHLEIILLNDGSTDGSAAICQAYADKDSRIKLINQPLGGSGVGAARNAALSYVTGDYILFVDNDDWLEDNHIELLYHSLTETNSDIAAANFTQFIQERQAFAFHLRSEDYYQKVFSIKEWFNYQYDGHHLMSQCFTVPWGKLYKADLFSNIVFPENEKVEDDLTIWKVYLMANQIVFTNTAIYYHRKLETSISKSVQNVHVFPLKSIEERITILSMIGFNIDQELRAYRWRLDLHKDSYLEAGMMQDYQQCIQKLAILEKWHQKNES